MFTWINGKEKESMIPVKKIMGTTTRVELNRYLLHRVSLVRP